MTDKDLERGAQPPGTSAPAAEPAVVRTAEEIQRWLSRYVAQMLESEEGSIDVSVPFHGFGMDSSAAVGMAGDLEEWLGFEVEPTAPYDYPTIGTLSQHLAEGSKARAAGRASPP